MEIIKKQIICDRCHKEKGEEESFIPVSDIINRRNYHLCNDCFELFRNYEIAVNELWKKQDKITKDFGFGKYLPKYGEDTDAETN